LQIDEKIIKESVFKSLELAIEKSKITFRVNPADYGYVEKLRPKLFATHKEIKSVMVVSDEAVHRGGCFLETAHGDVDASIESQLEIIRRSLEEAYTQREDD
jgi:flagellar assembly protein FliH